MNWTWANTLDQMWRSPGFPMWLTLAAAGFFAVIAIITLLRAEKSVANGALTVITLLAVGIALAATIRGFGSGSSGATDDRRSSSSAMASLPALACVDDLAGDLVLAACEKAVFGSPEAAAAALSYAARQITRLTGFGNVAAANKNMTPELEALRRAVEHDRYGLMAEVLVVREHCTPTDCAAFRSLTDSRRISANISEQTYEGLVGRYSLAWNAPAAPPVPPVAALVPGLPTGRPTNAEFPSAASTPPVSIMTAEPATTSASHSPAPSAATPTPSPRPTPSPALAAAKKQSTPRPARTPAAATSL
ncbi:MAG: hypothetical protein WBE54_12255, partial [Bradyrhizobium sp.]